MLDVMKRRRVLAGLGLLGLSSWSLSGRASLPAVGRPLRLGVLPITSTRILLGNYAPVRAYLQNALGQPLELFAAADFRTFVLNTERGEYDLIVTAVHFARLAQLESGWLPLVRYTALHQTLLVTLRDRPLARLEELRGRVVAGPDPLTLVSMEGRDWLQARGLREDADYTYLATPTTPSAAHALINGQSPLFLGTPQGLLNTPRDVRDQLAVFTALPERANLTWLAHPRLAAQQAQLKAALLGMNGASAELGSFFEATGYQGVREVQGAELTGADKYLPRLRAALRATR